MNGEMSNVWDLDWEQDQENKTPEASEPITEFIYRYEVSFGRISLDKIKVIRETKSCFVIEGDYYKGQKEKFILKTGNGKRYAYAKKEDAYTNLVARTKRRLKIMTAHLQSVKNLHEALNKVDKQKFIDMDGRYDSICVDDVISKVERIGSINNW
jgi:hypothetical protein